MMSPVLKCGICLVYTSPIEGDYFVSTLCGHIFHNRCIKRWLFGEIVTRCPMCRCPSGIDSKSLIKLHSIGPVLEAGDRGEKYSLKLTMLGDSGTGKTTLLNAFAKENGATPSPSTPTVGLDVAFKTITISGVSIKLTLWDCGGQDQFKAICPSYLRNSHGVCLLFDKTRSSTVENLESWLEMVNKSTHTGVVVMLIGNKLDLRDNIQVTLKDGEELAGRHGLDYMETSSTDYTNVDEAFRFITGKILERLWESNLIESVEVSSLKPISLPLSFASTAATPSRSFRCPC